MRVRVSPSAPICLLALLLAGCEAGEKRKVVELRGPTMGTVYAVTAVAPPPGLDETALRHEVEAVLAAIDRRFSTYRQDSELSALNRAAGGSWIDADPELVAVLTAGQAISRESQGAFDMTVKPLLELWGFGALPGSERVPGVAEIKAVRAVVGYARLELRQSAPAVRKADSRVRLDVNAIVPGYAADRIAARLEHLGIANYRVDIGGEMRLRGQSGSEAPWAIGIERPVAGSAQAAWVIEPGNAAVATSGVYRDAFVVDGRRYSHMMDPRSGHPIGHALASVTVIAESALVADAWSTALLVLGPEAGPRLARSRGMAAMFVTGAGDDFEVVTTPGFPPFRNGGKTP